MLEAKNVFVLNKNFNTQLFRNRLHTALKVFKTAVGRRKISHHHQGKEVLHDFLADIFDINVRIGDSASYAGKNSGLVGAQYRDYNLFLFPVQGKNLPFGVY